ncbi:sensor domain-containing diguanylate cyclase [Pseudoxanthomonas sp. JBR18]|uniref:sensor domain-containing diguanylate cyclase n=1 Tax=Pseudoxanthomonas sp. JBR18 TaxID=2969308 RepID=UPI00230680E4|nr:sensor domain-containing diguanylate cyclase [Pseudoxanthomonas sp. JBR18]WCE06279.1 sensor domain-containing diguanylate cyclase [Pseudoxanthomonas sp. JBR18]
MSEASLDPGKDSDVYKTLLESTKAIPWRIDWNSMTFSYVGPQIEALLGWEQGSWVGINDWVERMHPDDRDYVVNFCVSQSKAGVDHEADYRAMTKDGDYVWIRDVVHVVRKDGEVEALVGFMFDISERKKTEDHLMRLQKQLEELSYQDGLTGIANRRMFDIVLEREWAAAQQRQTPLSLLMMDIDYFKQYNDHYGHIRGDEALRTVASTLAQAANNPRDFVARIGGEEFIWLLPDTSAANARQVAEKCMQLVRQQQIPHARSSVSPLLSLSVGVGTVTPGAEAPALSFVEAVDALLYQAKRNGRMRAESGTF